MACYETHLGSRLEWQHGASFHCRDDAEAGCRFGQADGRRTELFMVLALSYPEC